MQNFLEEVVQKVWNENDTPEDLIFVLPSKRAGTFLTAALAKKAGQTFFSPEIYSIEHFIEKISGLAYASNTQQLFMLYQAYLDTTAENTDSFLTFSRWGQTVLQDFNEIDRYLVEPNQLFSNLAAIQEINHWSLQSEKTEMMVNYLQFWYNLEPLYRRFNELLLQEGLGHQGLVYRKAYDALPPYLANNQGKTFIFIGFNALNSAESEIFQHILSKGNADIYWDIDTYFLNDDVHDAGFFIRRHLKSWPYLKSNGLKGTSDNYLTNKNIELIGIPKNVSQAKYTGHLLVELQNKHPERLKKAAVILGDETLLNPLLNAIPANIPSVNITMGYPLHKTALATFFEQFLRLYINTTAKGWYYQDILDFLSHPNIQILLSGPHANTISNIMQAIKNKNWTYVRVENLVQRIDEKKIASLLFVEKTPAPKEFIEICLQLIAELKIRLYERKDDLGLEHLYRFHTLFNQVLNIIDEYNFISDLKSLQGVYRELVSAETLDFQGEPLEGLQIMGMLESRNLDFETIIITSVNEGILPSGKSNNSFIPYDIKVNFGLPTYKEKDAVYTYHFYRLLQRAKYVYILYNTEPDVLEGGERSRLIGQLLADENRAADIKETIAAPSIRPTLRNLEFIEKDAGLIELIKNHATSGFSPTSLSNYIRNPLDFYKRNLLGIDDVEEVEETIAANTFGTIVHDTLEDLYRPFMGDFLTEKQLDGAKARVRELVQYHFSKSYLEGDITRGKNLIAYNVVVRYVENFLDLEMTEIQKHRIKLIGLEEKLNLPIEVAGIDFPIILKGKLDRIDEVDGKLRIIDYKTGNVTSSQVEIVDWSEITSEYDYSKAFQLLFYALMYNSKEPISSFEAGIFSFKNLNSGLLRFATKDKKGSRKKDTTITAETLTSFTSELKKMILEICNPQIPFQEKEL